MSENPLVSIIVPVYKAEQYLRQCIDSITAQTYPHLEILLVDDGSPDRSGEICDEYALRDKRISVIHKDNGGPGSARNAALDVAKGDFITFVDSDDFISADAVAAMLDGFVDDKVGVAQIAVYQTDGVRTWPYTSLQRQWLKEFTRYSYDTIFEMMAISNKVIPIACSKMYRRDVLCSMRFIETRNNEDVFFCYYLAQEMEHRKYDLAYVPKFCYNYRITPHSISNNEEKLLSVDEYENLKVMAEDCGRVHPEFKWAMDHKIMAKLLQANARCLRNETAYAQYYKTYHAEIKKYPLWQFGKGLDTRDKIVTRAYAFLIKYLPQAYRRYTQLKRRLSTHR